MNKRELVQMGMAGNVVVLDTETTGLDRLDQVVEIAVCDITGKVLFESFIKPTVPVNPSAQEIHNISADKLKSSPSIGEVWEELFSILKDKKVIAFNASFDKRLVKQSLEANAQEALEQFSCIEWFCAMELSVSIFGATNKYGTRSLANTIREIGVVNKNPHRASGDAVATANFLDWVIVEHEGSE